VLVPPRQRSPVTRQHARWRDLKDQYLFGMVDGINGAVGLVIGLLRSHAAAQIILVALLSRAGSSAVSMAGAEYPLRVSPNPPSRVSRF
jgi:hypothetical protein